MSSDFPPRREGASDPGAGDPPRDAALGEMLRALESEQDLRVDAAFRERLAGVTAAALKRRVEGASAPAVALRRRSPASDRALTRPYRVAIPVALLAAAAALVVLVRTPATDATDTQLAVALGMAAPAQVASLWTASSAGGALAGAFGGSLR